MALKFFKANLPWIVPTVAIVFAASGYFDRSSNSDVTSASVTTQVQTNVAQPVEVLGTTSTSSAALQAGSNQEQLVTRTDSGIGADLSSGSVAQVSAALDAASLDGGVVPTSENAQSGAQSTQVASFDENPAAFFRDAQASLDAAGSCKEDLQALTERAHVYFPSGGLTAEEAGLEQARLIGSVAENCNGVGILVTGHSDPSGDPAVNLRLSQQRAELIIQRISASGIDTSSFVPQGFGDRRPSNVVGPNSRAYYDRRVDFSVIELEKKAALNTSIAGAFVASCVTTLQAAVESTKLFYTARSIAAPSADVDKVVDLAKQAAACPQARLRIVGQHSGETWADEDVHTGILRAKALMTAVIGQGVPSEQVIIGAPSRSVNVLGQPELSNSRVDFDVIIDPV